MRNRMWVSIMIGLHTVIYPQVVIHDTVTVCPDTSSFSGHPAYPLAKTDIYFNYAPVYNPCGELTYCRPGTVNGVYDPCGGGCYTFSPDFSQVTYTSQIRSAVIPLVNLSESGGSISFDASRPQSEIGHRIFAYHITNQPDLRVCWGADPTSPPTGAGTLNVAYGERLFFSLQEDAYSPGHIPVEITPICPYEFMVRFEDPALTLRVNGFESGMATYEVVPDTDSVAHGSAVPLDVIAWKQLEEGTEEIPETTELDFTFMSGAEYGTYIGPDSLQSDTLRNVLYRDVKAGRVQFAANGLNPEKSKLVIFSVHVSGKECPAGAGVAFVQPAAEYSFRVNFEKDTLNYLDSTRVFVSMVDATGACFDPPYGMMLSFELDSIGQINGALYSYIGAIIQENDMISYEEAHQGRILYKTDSDTCSGNKMFTLYVFDSENFVSPGYAEAVIQNSIHFSVFIPNEKVIWPTLPGGIYSGRNRNRNNFKDNIEILLLSGSKPIINQSVTTQIIMRLPSGGHDHIASQPPLDSLGVFKVNGTDIEARGQFTARTDTSGRILFQYMGPPYGGIFDLVSKTCIGDDFLSSSDSLLVTAGLLLLLPEDSCYIKIGGTCDHHGPGASIDSCTTPDHNHWGTLELLTAIDSIATKYFRRFPGYRLRVNDISLESGGLFDSDRNWIRVPNVSHLEHRCGKQVDISDQINTSVVVNDRLIGIFTRACTDELFIHHRGHYHIRVQ